MPEPSSRAWYDASIAEFLRADSETVVGRLASKSDFSVLPAQREAWLFQLRLLQDHLGGLTGCILIEFSIPRMGRRIDTVLLIGPVVFVVEFKVGETVFDRAAIDQVGDLLRNRSPRRGQDAGWSERRDPATRCR
jgi:hypothetical protein